MNNMQEIEIFDKNGKELDIIDVIFNFLKLKSKQYHEDLDTISIGVDSIDTDGKVDLMLYNYQLELLESYKLNINDEEKIHTMDDIFKEIRQERQQQDEKWGIQDHPILDQNLIEKSPDIMCKSFGIPTEHDARKLCETSFSEKNGTWMHILVEELSEVASCGKDNVSLRKELIQSAAVLVAMIESLDRNSK